MSPDKVAANRRSPMWNLIFVSISFLLIFSAYASLEVVQSSLNAGVGVQSLCAVYSSFVVSSLVLPPVIIDRLGYKHTMALSVIGYGVYTAANFYPESYILIPAGIINGASAALLWAAARVYITSLAYHAAGERGKKGEKKIGFYFGVFYCIYYCSGLGNIIMSIFMTPQSAQPQALINASNNETFAWQSTTYISSTTSSNQSVDELCGVSQSSHWGSNSEIDADEGTNDAGVDVTMLYIMLGVYVAFAVIGGLLLLFAIDEVPQFNPEQYEAGMIDEEEPPTIDRNANKELIQEDSKEESKLETNEKSEKRGKVFLILATARLFKTSTQLQLMIPSTIQFGVFNSLLITSYTRFWVTCSLGIEYIGYMALVYGITSSLTAFCVGKLLRWVRRVTVFFVACGLEVTCIVILMLWSPPQEEPRKYLFFIFAGSFSVTYTVHRCINQTTFSSFFVEDANAGQSASAFLDSMGKAIMFGVAPVVAFNVQVYVLLTLLVSSGVTYYIAERRHSRYLKIQREKKVENLNGTKESTTDNRSSHSESFEEEYSPI